MSSLSVKLPITRNTIDGFAMIKDFQTLVKQNFKMLVLNRTWRKSDGARVRCRAEKLFV